jgi:glucose uptake protein
MFIVESYTTAIVFCVITMLCWGSWANTQKLAAASWRFELFYWDYVIGILLTSLLFAFTLGSMGSEGRPFLEDLRQVESTRFWKAFFGGVLFNGANILLVAAISIAGMSVAFPVGIGLALVIGVIKTYISNPQGNPYWLFGGVLLVSLAILLNAYAYQRMQKKSGISKKGLAYSVFAGLLMGQFYPLVAESMFPDFKVPEAGKLSPYTALFVFSLGIFVSNFVLNTIAMRDPHQGDPVSYRDYFRGSTKSHLTGVLGGMIWCVGMSLSIIASGKAGPAISYGLGQGATVVAAIWGIYIWREFEDAPRGIPSVLRIMLLLYILGLIAIILAR